MLGKRAAILLFLSSSASAHPSIGIVRTKAGVVFFSDLTHVRRIAPDGTKSIAVRNVHTHELYLDADGNLFGEHLWYEGDATKKWGHRVWRLAPDGSLDDVVPAREGFRTEFSFVRDGSGAEYFSDEGQRVWRRRPGASAELLASGFTDIRWMTSASEGTLFFVDGKDLVRVAPGGEVVRLALNLAEKRTKMVQVGPHHLLMGLWLDAAKNVYVAAWGAACVKKVTPSGAVSTVVKTSFPWSPTGGLVDPDGNLWVLEASLTDKVRVRRFSPNGAVKVY